MVPARGFATAEFETRTERAQRAMAEAGLAALLLTTEPEVRYFSGFLTPFGRARRGLGFWCYLGRVSR